MLDTMHEALRCLTEDHRRDASALARCRELLAHIGTAPEEEVASLLGEIIAGLKRLPSEGVPQEALLLTLIDQLWLRYRRQQPGEREPSPGFALSPPRVEQIIQLHECLAWGTKARHALLRVLTSSGEEAALKPFVEIITRGSDDAKGADLAFAPLFQHPQLPVQALFPGLLAAIGDPNVAVQVFDLANHVTRLGLVQTHPAAGRVRQLLQLFSALVHRLHDLPQKPEEFGSTPAEISQTVGRCLEHVVAMCHALALIGDERAVGKLRQALQLPHRRIRTEAAAALAQLGDKIGVETLVRLAQEPSVRRRAVAYLQELGQLDKVPEELRSDLAIAEAELAAWLAETSQIGLPPHRLELLDRRRQAWPGYEKEKDCYLFRFEYDLPRSTFCSVGIVGPVVHALSADLTKLPPEDVYAIYAGWHAEHEEIQETNYAQFTADQQDEAEAVLRELEDIGYDDVRVVKLARFFGQHVAVSAAHLAGEAGVVITAEDKMRWFSANAPASLGPEETYLLFKGRQLMAAFEKAAD